MGDAFSGDGLTEEQRAMKEVSPTECEHGMTTCPPCGFGLSEPVDPWPGVAFWDCTEDAERLHHESDEAAVEAWLDDMEKGECPTSVTVHGWKRTPVEVDGLHILEGALETLDEEHGDPDGDAAAPNKAMKVAALAFAEVIEEEFTSWSCERVPESDHEVDVRWDDEGEPHVGESKDTGDCRECYGKGTVTMPGTEGILYVCLSCRPQASKEAKA